MIVPHFLSDQIDFAVIIVGMVGAINAPTTGANTFENFKNQASQAAAVGVRFFSHLSYRALSL